MRLLELRLSAFGPFSDVTLDLSRAQPGLHLIYGGNEAGKSSALRALTGFFFGFPHVTEDTHLHKQLRVGARLSGDDAGELDLVRKKGRKRTLVDPGDRPVDEAPLRRLLGGVGPELFTTIFGLDHETLRSGADTLVRGKGHIGESLFEVGLGTAGLSDVLDDLRKQADAIYSPRARTRPLNEALKRCTTSKQEVRRESVTADAYLVQEKGLESARDDAAECEQKLRELTRSRHRLERIKRTLPLLARREQLQSRRRELGEVRLLPEDTPRKRESARRIITEATARREEIATKLRALGVERDALPAPHERADEERERDRLRTKLIAHEQSAARMPTLRGELSRLEADAEAVLRRLGREESLEKAEALRIDTSTQARITKLALEAGPVGTRFDAAKQAVALLESRARELAVRRDAMPPERDGAELARARAEAVRAGDLRAQLRQAEEAEETARLVVVDLAESLGVPRSDANHAASLAVPASSELTRLSQQHRELVSETSRVDGLLAAAQERAADVRAALDALAGEGDVPSEADLEAARRHRDQALETLVSSGRRLAPEHPEVRDLAKAIATADAVADRLRREADRVARKARLAADREQLDAMVCARQDELAALDRSLETHRAELAELCRELPGSARSADEWLAWLGRHGELVRAERAREMQGRAREGIATLAETLAGALRRALASHGEVAPSAQEDPAEELSTQLDAALVVEERLQAEAKTRQDVERALRDTGLELERARGELADAETSHAAWRKAWKSSMKPLGLTATASPEEATAVLNDVTELFRKIDEAARVKRELDVEETAATEFEEEVRRVAAAHASEVESSDHAITVARSVVSQLSDRIRARAQRARIEKEIESLEDLAREQRERMRVGELELEELVRLAGAEDEPGLVAAESASHEAATLDGQLESVDDQLLTHGASVADLAEEAQSLSADEVALELEEVQASIEDLDRDRLATQRRIGELEVGLSKLGGPNRAGEAAIAHEQHLAEAASLVSEYVRLRTAVAFLEREIEIYREANQDPLLHRAGQLLSRLTRGRYHQVHATLGDDDRAVFSVERSDGPELEVDALSDGTRDQLYLALRLATLERRLESAEPMPLVLDDILVHFDDERASAALELLGELAERIQILFFTHHARLRELARAAVPPARLCEHELPAPPAPAHVTPSL